MAQRTEGHLQPEGRYCAHHQKACELPRRLDGLIAGFSCKDFSRANKARKLFHGADIFTAEHSPGQSADTIRGLLQVLDTCPPDFFLLENVDDLAMELHGEALDMLLSAGSHRGYDCHSYILDAADFGLAQSRRRLFILGMLRPGRGFKIRDYTRFSPRSRSCGRPSASQGHRWMLFSLRRMMT